MAGTAISAEVITGQNDQTHKQKCKTSQRKIQPLSQNSKKICITFFSFSHVLQNWYY
jgi:hypothetical protein